MSEVTALLKRVKALDPKLAEELTTALERHNQLLEVEPSEYEVVYYRYRHNWSHGHYHAWHYDDFILPPGEFWFFIRGVPWLEPFAPGEFSSAFVAVSP